MIHEIPCGAPLPVQGKPGPAETRAGTFDPVEGELNEKGLPANADNPLVLRTTDVLWAVDYFTIGVRTMLRYLMPVWSPWR